MRHGWTRRLGIAVLVLGSCLLLTAANCDKDSDPVVPNEEFGDFPSVGGWWNNKNPDQRDFFSIEDQDVQAYRYFNCNGSNGRGILLFTTNNNPGAGPVFSGGNVLWAAYNNSGRWTPPVEIFGENQEDNAGVDLDTACILWLQGSDVGSRQGDAVLLYKRQSNGQPDVGTSGVQIDTGNDRLYSCYFDASESGRALGSAADASPLLYGFSTLATFVDDDPNGTDEELDSPVLSFGWVSDGLIYSGEYGEDGNCCKSGDDVTFAFAVWTQNLESNMSNQVLTRLRYNRFVLSGTTTRFSLTGVNTLDVESSLDLEDLDSVATSFLVHNGLVVAKYNLEGDAEQDDFVLQGYVFGANGPSSPATLSRTDAQESDVVNPDCLDKKNLYGDDHGLPLYWFFYCESGFNDGNVSSESDAMAATLTLDGDTARMEEIDNFDSANGNQPIFGDQICSKITRCGENIVVWWRQNHEDGNDAGEDPTVSLFVRGVAARATNLSDALTDAALRLNSELNSDVDDDDHFVFEPQPQYGMVDGEGCPNLGFQSNRFRVYWTWVQNDQEEGQTESEVAGDGNQDESFDRTELHYAFVEFETEADNTSADGLASEVPPCFTSTSGADSDQTVDSADEDWGALFSHVGVDTDAGFAVIYLNQGNNKDDDEKDSLGVDLFPEPRVFFSLDGATPLEISSDGSSFGTNAVSPDYFKVQNFGVLCTPCDDNASNKSHAGRFVHIFIQEEHSDTQPHVLAWRVWDTGNNTVDLQNQFTPALELNSNNKSQNPPERIDRELPEDTLFFVFNDFLSGASSAVSSAGDDSEVYIQADGNRLAVYLDLGDSESASPFGEESGHLYYNEYSGTSWREAAGLPDPTRVDHDSDNHLNSWAVWDSSDCRACPTFSKAVVTWIKEPESSGDRRLNIRVHR